MTGIRCLLTVGWLVMSLTTPADAQTKLLRFPDVHGDRVVFVYAGDLWTASTSGGRAARLTAHPGLEVFPKFSPDGQWVAFTGQYDGDEQVYVVPATGGSWVIEGYGVEPDIEVENDPKAVIAGQDPQLERAIEEITRMIRDDPRPLPTRPAPPVKTP